MELTVSFSLSFMGFQHLGAHFGGRQGELLFCPFPGPRDIDLKVDPVKQRAGNFGAVLRDPRRAACALMTGMIAAKVAARATV
ncbi:hypothetical protein PAJ34TS1_45570 [Paenibacillus azoreducens]|uniref:Uncharacterized protein n=1 Tax=Paenibacillus azoreducens TaxID=116718 RepID=A0A919YC71_9BACL|nr:hypothetical protein J34TS1_27960 [Paenibacillus azoreducens]